MVTDHPAWADIYEQAYLEAKNVVPQSHGFPNINPSKDINKFVSNIDKENSFNVKEIEFLFFILYKEESYLNEKNKANIYEILRNHKSEWLNLQTNLYVYRSGRYDEIFENLKHLG